MTDVTGIEIVDDRIVGAGGFLTIRRTQLANRRADGTLSAQYLCDFIVRPYGQDAVVVVAWHRRATDGGIDVLVRDGLRPALHLGRDPAAAPLPEPPRMMLTELVAGILEAGDRGEAGLRERAIAELAEEAGFAVTADRVQVLGAGAFPSPGSMVEKFYFVAIEVDPATQHPFDGDGSPMEEGATTRWLDLDGAIAACVRGELDDAKTELGLRRLRDSLA
jgi:ADP-ribose pyrophosphatase